MTEKILVVSDIHGCLPTLQKVVNFYHKEHYNLMIVLGDILNYGPRNCIPDGIDAKGIATLLNSMKEDIVAVRGNCDSEVDQMLLEFPIMETYTILVNGGKRIFLTHGHIYNEENMPTMRADAFFYGHTHLWKLEKSINGTLICNTGSITFPKQNRIATFATIDNSVVNVRALDGSVIKSEKL